MSVQCSECSGTGEFHEDRWHNKAGHFTERAACDECDGAGEVDSVYCSHCGAEIESQNAVNDSSSTDAAEQHDVECEWLAKKIAGRCNRKRSAI